MSYVDTILEPGEQVRYRTSISWTIYANGIWIALAALLCAYVGLKFYAGWLFAVSGALGLIALALFAVAHIKRLSTEIAVTDRRIIFKQGLVRRHTVEMNMTKIESVDVNQSILGRILNYGDVTILGVGEGRETIKTIASPLAFRNFITAR